MTFDILNSKQKLVDFINSKLTPCADFEIDSVATLFLPIPVWFTESCTLYLIECIYQIHSIISDI